MKIKYFLLILACIPFLQSCSALGRVASSVLTTTTAVGTAATNVALKAAMVGAGL